MYKFEDIRDVHLEITSKCQAKCPTCPRRINGGPMNPFIKLDDINTLLIFLYIWNYRLLITNPRKGEKNNHT